MNTESLTVADIDAPTPEPRASSRQVVYRHALPIRIMHWINVIALTLMFFSGLQIFNAHPNLYWGNRSDKGKEILSLAAHQDATGSLVGTTRIGHHEFTTTGVLGVSKDGNGMPTVRGFPSWITVPGPGWLAMGRRWHFFFAWVFVLNGLCYVGYSLAKRHLQHDLWPTGADWRGIGRSIIEHIRFKHPHGAEALRYNILQRLAYLTVIFVFGVGIVLMGLAMSPRMDAVLSPLVEAVGGRQSARTIHFIIAWAFVAFVLIHLFEVLISGVFNQLRGMITGYYRIDSGEADTVRIHPAEVETARVDTHEVDEVTPDAPAATEERPHD
ncbi:cytochrome b/b6 domain-containing protein [Rhodanobacter sp. MP7CTX1]|uniref:cytochrome b/b6 domain-containing protein n=1 Tax=Rhodanobacter sp. MP7CTX1 TaxID=2723084 RepID=UPI0017C28380|nr:thiosulfate reductase cytochrome b subunit [Rhodanobacter sp. MP7CTX1]